MAESGFKMDKGFWISTAVSLGVLLLGLFIYDTIKTKMVSKSTMASAPAIDEVDEEEMDEVA